MRQNGSSKRTELFGAIAIILFLLLLLQIGERLRYKIGYPSIEQLLIDKTAFPVGWTAEKPDTDFPPLAPCTTGRDEVEYATREYYSNPPSGFVGGALIRLQRFKSSSRAANYYRTEVSNEFRDSEWNTPWIIPGSLKFESSTANQFRYGCSLEGSPELAKPVCNYVAQYGVYVVDFGITLNDTNVITYTNVTPIFVAIDQQMSEVSGSK